MSRRITAAVAGLVLATVLTVGPGLDAEGEGESKPKLPSGDHGLAARYPGDVGIAKDPAVLLHEDFSGRLKDLLGRWENQSGVEHFSMSDDVPKHARNKGSLLVTHIGGGPSMNHLYQRLAKGQNRVFARFYVKFDKDCWPVHHFGTHIGGNNPATRWPDMKAGVRRPGDKHFCVSAEPFGKSWTWDFYTYWHEMRGSPPKGQTWGNVFIRDPKLAVARGRWICVELMVKMNDPKDHDGELALWIDGRLVSHLGKGFPRGTWTFDKFTPGSKKAGVTWDDTRAGRRRIDGDRPFEGFRWRTDKALDINYVWISLYMTKVKKGHKSKVWFDQVVVATEYIGPIAKPARRPARK